MKPSSSMVKPLKDLLEGSEVAVLAAVLDLVEGTSCIFFKSSASWDSKLASEVVEAMSAVESRAEYVCISVR